MVNIEKMIEERPLLSLCIPTNGEIKWVIPVLDSIYAQVNDNNIYEFEVVIEDNGSNQQFKKAIDKYLLKYDNLKYYKSQSRGFLCQIDSFNDAKGHFVKFVNHRFKLLNGALDSILETVQKEFESRTEIFFANGNLNNYRGHYFEAYVKHLSYWSSWSGGLGFWKDKIHLEQLKIDKYFPHICVLFADKKAGNYLIDNQILFEEVESGHANKSSYNLFYVFGVVYPSLILDLVKDELISIETFESVLNSLKCFLADQYINFIVLKRKTSYDLSKSKQYIDVFFGRASFEFYLLKRLLIRFWRKIVVKDKADM